MLINLHLKPHNSSSFAYERPVDVRTVLFAEKRMIRIARAAGMIVRNLRWGPRAPQHIPPGGGKGGEREREP